MGLSQALFNLSALKLALVKSTGTNVAPQTDGRRRKRRIEYSDSSSDDSEDEVDGGTEKASDSEDEVDGGTEKASDSEEEEIAAEEMAQAEAEAAKARVAISNETARAAARAAARAEKHAAEAAAAAAAPAPRRPQRERAGKGVSRYVPNDLPGSQDLTPGRGVPTVVRGYSDDAIEDTWLPWEGNPFFREHLKVKKSTIHYFEDGIKGELVGQQGLFTKEFIPSGEWIGFYTGDQITKKQWAKLTLPEQNENARYAAEIKIGQDWVMMVPPNKLGTKEPDFEQYPLAAINEPDRSQVANVFTAATKLPMYFPMKNYPDPEPTEFVVIGMFTCKDVEPGEELLWNYGSGYEPMREKHGNYTPGEACPELPDDKKDAFAGKSLKRARLVAQHFQNAAFVRKLLHDPDDARGS